MSNNIGTNVPKKPTEVPMPESQFLKTGDKLKEQFLKIGDKVYIRGEVDEIRKDTIIIHNSGGYFGTTKENVTKRQCGQWAECVFKHDGKYTTYEETYYKCNQCSHITDCKSAYCENCGAVMLNGCD